MPRRGERGTSEPSLDETEFEDYKNTYREAFNQELRLGDILEDEPWEDRDALQEYTMGLPLFGPYRTRNSSSYFDDRPLIRQLAQRHAAAYQLAPLYGNVEGYSGDHLFSEGIELHSEDNPFTPNEIEALFEEIANRCAEKSLVRPGEPLVLVGSARFLAPVRGRPLKGPVPGVKRLRSLTTDLRAKTVPRAPRDRIYVLPHSKRVARLLVSPELGEVEFKEPIPKDDRFVIPVKAWNKLHIDQLEQVLGFAVDGDAQVATA